MASTALGVSKSSAKAAFTAALVWLSLGGEMRNKLITLWTNSAAGGLPSKPLAGTWPHSGPLKLYLLSSTVRPL